MVRFTVLASGSKGNSSIVTHCPGDATASQDCTRILVDAGLSCRELFRRMRLVGEDPATLDAIVITHEHQDHINGLAVTARKLGIPVYFTEATHRAWVRQVTPRKRIGYAEWAAQYKQDKEERRAAKESSFSGPHHPGQPVPDPDPEPDPSPEPDPVPDPAPMQLSSCDFTDPQADPDPDADLAAESCAEASVEVAADPSRLPSVRYFKPGEVFSIGDIAVSPFTIPHDAADPVGFVFSAEGRPPRGCHRPWLHAPKRPVPAPPLRPDHA